MLRKSLIFSAVVALSITLRAIPIGAQRNDAPPLNGNGQPPENSSPNTYRGQPNGERGDTKNLPPPTTTAAQPDTQSNTRQSSDPWQQNAANKTEADRLSQIASQPSQGGNGNPQADRPGSISIQPAQPATANEVLRPPQNAEPPSTNQQSKLSQALEKGETDPVVWVTVVIAIFAGWQVAIYRDMRDHAIVIERAYVTLSHTPPGVKISHVVNESMANPIPHQDVSINLTVRNFGNTPADVTAFLFHFLISDGPLPERPPYDHALAKAARVSLVKEDHFTFFVNTPLPADGIKKIMAGELKLHAIGYVDYIDKFGLRHRSSYARVYEPSIDTNMPWKPRKITGSAASMIPDVDEEAYARRSNLPFIMQPGYNYDRPRVKGEGDDWD